MNDRLSSFVMDNFSCGYRAHISRVWGLGGAGDPFDGNPLLKLHFHRWRESICLLSSLSPDTCTAGGISNDIVLLKRECVKPPCPSGPNGGSDGNSSNNLSTSHATMKVEGDPLIPPLTRMWNDSCRTWACHLYAYATPTPEAISKLASLCPLVEIGAGTGYWAHMVRQYLQMQCEVGTGDSLKNSDNRRNGSNNNKSEVATELTVSSVTCSRLSADLLAYDKAPPTNLKAKQGGGKSNEYHGRSRAWTTVSKGGVEAVAAHAAEGAGLFLCYPPPDSDMALQALRLYIASLGNDITTKSNKASSGTNGRNVGVVVYVGEYRGDTGTRQFEKLLESAFRCTDVIPLPNWGDTCYSLSIWEQTQGLDIIPNCHPHPALRCDVCGFGAAPGSHLYRCRLTYSMTVCSDICAKSAKGRKMHANELAFKFLLCKPNTENRLNMASMEGRGRRGTLNNTESITGSSQLLLASSINPTVATAITKSVIGMGRGIEKYNSTVRKKKKKRKKLRNYVNRGRLYVGALNQDEGERAEEDGVINKKHRCNDNHNGGIQELGKETESTPLFNVSSQWYMTLTSPKP